MNIDLDVLFEKLHKYVFKYNYQSTNIDWGLPTKYFEANRHNKYKKYNKLIAKIYTLLYPFFFGWRSRLEKKYPNKKEYKRYYINK